MGNFFCVGHKVRVAFWFFQQQQQKNGEETQETGAKGNDSSHQGETSSLPISYVRSPVSFIMHNI